MSINRDMDKKDVVHIYMIEYYPAIKRNKIMPLAETWIDLRLPHRVKVREKQIPYINAYMWNLDKWYR